MGYVERKKERKKEEQRKNDERKKERNIDSAHFLRRQLFFLIIYGVQIERIKRIFLVFGIIFSPTIML